MGRKRKPFKRPVEKLSSRLIIIASEGSKTEENYFITLAKTYDNSKVHVEIIPSENTRSDPESVFCRLNKFYEKYDLDEYDSLYLVIDKDRWPDQNLAKIAQLCQQKGFILTLSNPCFELWLLLHEKDISKESPPEKEKVLKNEKINQSRRYLDSILKDLWSGYNKSNCKFDHIMGKILDAIENAKKLDLTPSARWPNDLGTRVYLPVEDIANQNA